MDEKEALQHLRTLINVASDADDMEQVRKLLSEMQGVIDNALPAKPRDPTRQGQSTWERR